MSAITAKKPSKKTVAALLAEHLGGQVEAWTVSPIRTGKFNTSFTGQGPAGQVVIRLAPPETSGLLFYEKLMMRQEPELHATMLAHADLPIPKIVAFDFSHAAINRDFVIMERLPGRPFSQVNTLSHNQREQVLFQVGQILRQIHQIQGQHYGYNGPHQPMEPQTTWWAAFQIMWQKLLADVQTCGMYTPQETADGIALLTAYQAHFQHAPQPHLLHMDVWSQNILVDKAGKVTGLLDFDRALWGDPEIEFAVLDYCGLSGSPFWEGYQSKRPHSPESRTRHSFYILYEVLKYIPISIWRRDDLPAAEDYKQMANHILARLKASLG